jgi:hypothetical protein
MQGKRCGTLAFGDKQDRIVFCQTAGHTRIVASGMAFSAFKLRQNRL